MNYISEKLHNQLTATTCTFHGCQDPIRRNQMHSGRTDWPAITFVLDGITEDDIIKAHIKSGNDNINKTIMKPSILAHMTPTARPRGGWQFNDETLDNQVIYYVSGHTGVKIGITKKDRIWSNNPRHNRLAHMRLTFNDPTLKYLAIVDVKATTGERAFYVENQIKWDMEKSGFQSLAIKNRQGAVNTEIFGAEHHPKLWKSFVTKFKGYVMHSKSKMIEFNELAGKWSIEEVQKSLDKYGTNKRFDNKTK